MDISKYPELTKCRVHIQSEIFQTVKDALEMFTIFSVKEAKDTLESFFYRYSTSEDVHTVDENRMARKFKKLLLSVIRALSADKSGGRKEIRDFFESFPLQDSRGMLFEFLDEWLSCYDKISVHKRQQGIVFYRLANLLIDATYIIYSENQMKRVDFKKKKASKVKRRK